MFPPAYANATEQQERGEPAEAKICISGSVVVIRSVYVHLKSTEEKAIHL